MSLKTNKSFLKRIKITKNGKLKIRKPGKNHFNSRESRASQLNDKVPADFVITNKSRARFLPYN